MSNLLNQIKIEPFIDKATLYILTFLIAFIMFSLISNYEDNKKLTSIIIHVLLFLGLSIGLNSFITYKNNKIKSAIDNKEYTLKINGGILDLTSQSPYLESKQFKIIYQDNSKIQVEYQDKYYDIDKSKEKIDAKNRPSSEN